jgi:hypothetical protein
MLIDYTYFVGSISLPNLDKALNQAKVTEAITAYEDEILERVLGANLFTSYKTNPGTARFLNLINGAVNFSFTLDGRTINRIWAGLKVKSQSFIACYVYYQYQTNNITFTTGIGEMEAKAELLQRASINDKMVKAINKASELIGQGTVIEKSELQSYQHSDDAASLFNYLLANKSTFPEWEFTPLNKINVFGF